MHQSTDWRAAVQVITVPMCKSIAFVGGSASEVSFPDDISAQISSLQRPLSVQQQIGD